MKPQDTGHREYLEDEPPTNGTDSFRANRKCHFAISTAAFLAIREIIRKRSSVSRYVKWLNDPGGFGHNYIREAGLFVDLSAEMAN